jgi:hypothetical protein
MGKRGDGEGASHKNGAITGKNQEFPTSIGKATT